MNKDLLVEIFVPTNDDGTKGSLGTGYPIAKNLILTARHVLFPDNRDDSQKIEFRWHHRHGEDREWQPITDIVWQSDGDFDAALIECPFPDDISYVALVSDERPVDDANWKSEGFPMVGRKDETTTAVPMRGETYSAAETADRFQLGVKDEPTRPELWQGASGSPVFVGARLIGVITTCLGNFDGKRLEATPIWKLLKDNRFCELIGYKDRKSQLESLVRQVEEALQRSESVTDQLWREMPSHLLSAIPYSAAGLASALVSIPIDQLLTCANKAQNKLKDDRDKNLICDVVQVVLPCIIDGAHGSAVEYVKNKKNDPAFAVIELPTDLKTVAEIIMAAVDNRAAAFRFGDRFPEGKWSLPMPPEGGIDTNISVFNKSWDQHLIKKIATDDQLTRYSTEELVQMVAFELSHLAENGVTHYVILTFPAKTPIPEFEDLQQRFLELKNRYPSVVFIYLRNDGRRALQEQMKFRPLSDLVISTSRKRSSSHETFNN